MISLSTVLAAVQLAGSAAPAFKALFDAALPLLKPADQVTAKAAYAEAIARSDKAHADLQGLD